MDVDGIVLAGENCRKNIIINIAVDFEDAVYSISGGGNVEATRVTVTIHISVKARMVNSSIHVANVLVHVALALVLISMPIGTVVLDAVCVISSITNVGHVIAGVVFGRIVAIKHIGEPIIVFSYDHIDLDYCYMLIAIVNTIEEGVITSNNVDVVLIINCIINYGIRDDVSEQISKQSSRCGEKS